jgi:predicted DNA-binding transcriptional regulator YafY
MELNTSDNTKRLSRLTAILLKLQTKRLLTSSELGHKFSVSNRTIYRDIKALEEAGVPILTEDGKGYYLMEGYRIPPVMFTESEANALITAEQLVLKSKDASFVKEYAQAIDKIKSVLTCSTREKVNLLSNRIALTYNRGYDQTTNLLSTLQLALTNFKCSEIEYISIEKKITQRIIEPFALYGTQENWVLVALCQLRSDFRAFRLDRIQRLKILNETFEPHKITLQEYFELCNK